MTRSAWIVLAVAVLIIAGLGFITQSQTLSDTQADLATVQAALITEADAAIATATQAAIVQAQVVSDTQQEAATVQAQALVDAQNEAATVQAEVMLTAEAEAADAQWTAVAEVQNQAATVQAVALEEAANTATTAQAQAIADVQNEAAIAQAEALLTAEAEAAKVQATSAAQMENLVATATIAQVQAQTQADIAATVQANLQATISALETQLADVQASTPLAATPTTATVTGVYNDIAQARLPDGGFVLGSPDAPITIVEFGDYSCPPCQQYTSTIDQFIDNYVRTGKARYEYRIFPTHGGELTRFIGQIQSCLEEQQTGAFWEAKAILYEIASAGNYDEEVVRVLTERLGLDYEQALECSAANTQVDSDVELGRRLGVQGTPAVLVRYGDNKPEFITFNDQTYDSGGVPYEVLAAVVDAGLPTITGTTVSREGWQRIEGNNVSLELPPTWFGGDLLNNPDALADAITALGPEYAQFSQLFAQNPELMRLIAFDSESPDGFSTNVNVLLQEMPLTLTLESYLDIAIPQLPPNLVVDENDIVEVSGREVVRLVISADFPAGNVKILQYSIIRDSQLWVVTYTTSVDDFEDKLPLFEASFETFETQSSSA
jgi:protein-disulfide isomerase